MKIKKPKYDYRTTLQRITLTNGVGCMVIFLLTTVVWGDPVLPAIISIAVFGFLMSAIFKHLDKVKAEYPDWGN